jgi:AcrR family transcriptional regulator
MNESASDLKGRTGSAGRKPAASRRRESRDSADRLIAAGEELYGKHGLYGVPLRRIVEAAGCSNKYAVQYHFGDAAGLAQAILRRRLVTIDRRQADLLAQFEAAGRLDDVRAIVEILLRPALEEVNASGERSFARFAVALLNSPEGVQYFTDLFPLRPAESRLIELLTAALPAAPYALVLERVRRLTIMVLSSVFNGLAALAGPGSDALLIDDALDMFAAALATSPREPMRALAAAAVI